MERNLKCGDNKGEKNEEENVQLLYFKSFGHTNYITGFFCFLSGRIYNCPLQDTHICEVIGHYIPPTSFLASDQISERGYEKGMFNEKLTVICEWRVIKSFY